MNLFEMSLVVGVQGSINRGLADLSIRRRARSLPKEWCAERPAKKSE